jgi:general secretion pathway protein B
VLLVANIIVVLSTALRPRQPAEPPAAVSAAAPAATAAPASATVTVVPTVLTSVPAAATATALASSGARKLADEAELPVTGAPGSNPADDEPAVPPPTKASRASSPVDAPRSEVDLPSLSELGSAVPALRLDLHVYADRPADRYALINMHKAREGEMLPEGARVVAIDRDGVELSYRGTEFMLRPQ